ASIGRVWPERRTGLCASVVRHVVGDPRPPGLVRPLPRSRTGHRMAL
ncbi:MAG: hypothetical protein AVDCRST_MAG64-3352, partial [uncultured Phycisphaerae bacterium]